MNDGSEYIIETGIDLYGRRGGQHGKWKDIALSMAPPKKDPDTGKMIYSSVHHNRDGVALNAKQAEALRTALSRAGLKCKTRRNGQGYRVYRVA